MFAYIVRRLLLIIPVLIGVSLIVFFTMHLAPGDPAVIMAGPQASESDIEAIRDNLGLNEPFYVQYGVFVKGLITLNMGESVQTREPVVNMIKNRFPNTLVLAVSSILIASLIGLTAGIIAAVKQYSLFDNLSMVIALLGISLPSFWIGTVLIYLFGVKYRVMPISGLPENWWTLEWIKHLVMPATTLGVASAALIARMTRSSMLETIGKDFVRTARAKGVSEKSVIIKHVLKNALIPIITVIGLNFGRLLAGTVITESVFAINGIGRMIVRGISTRDFPVVQSSVMMVALLFVFINLFVDLIYAYIDPRIRYE
ncbi:MULTISPECIES: ABC transporter permease [unclassified Halanaerobium]|uniref:ABC transporter permease n=1 Tax=unclassified Halanaerobium TaxID=2641197 RepID=UPI000DF2C917|nr:MULTISPECIES: ABC transporter permease [unclassified Halanaerobium]RCW43750.1 peptide/nickel transport system permease protein [Halanaerobium sp. MA284_MarDTE_T2]RCW89181.1 peptide/nickel transport system permease protein [Halanaerobium sp. DL-01]